MPTRMIRETILDSNKYALLSTESKLFYIHLLLLADDFACISVSETFLRRRAFHDAPSGQKIAALLTELTDADMVRCYEVDRACFAFIPKFRQRLQRNTLKHPKPPESLYQDDKHARDLFNKNNDESINPTVGQQFPNRAPTVPQRPEVKRREVKPIARTSFDLFWRAWPASPRKASKGKCLALWQQKKFDAIAVDIVAHVEAMKLTKGWQDGFIPGPLVYLRDERWDGAEMDAPGLKVAL